MKKLIFAVVILALAEIYPQKKALTFEQAFLFGAPQLTEPLPTFVKWTEAGAVLKNGRKYLLLDYDFGVSDYIDYSELTVDLPDEYKVAQIAETGKDLLRYVLKSKGNLYYFSAEDNDYKQLTALKGDEQNPKFSPDYSKVAFTNGNNLFVVDVNSGLTIQLTDDGSETIKNGYASWVYYEEILGRKSKYRAFYWSRDSRFVAFLRFDDSPVPRFPIFNAEGTHGKLEWEFYPKAGDPDPKVWLCVADILSGKITVVDSATNSEKYIAGIGWTPENELFYQTVNRSQDTLKFFAYNLKSKKTRLLYEEFQSSWVDFNESVLFEKTNFYFLSDYDGVGKVYCYDYSGNKLNEFGDDNINLVKLRSVDNAGNVYCEGFPLGSADNYFYKLNGKGIENLTPRSGFHVARISPAGNFMIDVYSNLHEPQKLIAYDFAPGRDSVLFDAKTEAFDEYDIGRSELFFIENRDGIKLPAIKILPSDFTAEKKYPVLFYIYGGPGYPLVKNRFPYWYFTNYYAQLGMIVVIVDNRGAGHYGKKVLAQLHGNLGKYDLNDFIDAAEYMKTLQYVDTARIGITGGSYGGYMTLLALTRGADTFTHGLAEFAVSDWRLYDNVYTERYMDKPSENPEGYEYASALNYADKLKGKLRITAGNMDDNVHYQNTLQMIEKLENAGKSFELMIYTNEKHGYRRKWLHAAKENLDFWKRSFKLEN